MKRYGPFNDEEASIQQKQMLAAAYCDGNLSAIMEQYKHLTPELVKETIGEAAKGGKEGKKARELLGKITEVAPDALSAEHVELAIEKYRENGSNGEAKEVLLKILKSAKVEDLIKASDSSDSKAVKRLLDLELEQRVGLVQQGSGRGT
jgi:hypothetical protein